VEEVLGWVDYKVLALRGYQFRQDLGRLAMSTTPAPQGASPHEFLMRLALATNLVPVATPAPREDFLAPPILAVRAARRAIAANPDHPDGYYALGRALADPDLPITDAERMVGRVTAYRQCLSRLPSPDEYRAVFKDYNRRAFVASPTEVAGTLAQLYLGRNPQDGRPQGTLIDVFPLAPLAGDVYADRSGRPSQIPFLLSLDLAREALVLAGDYAAVELSLSSDAEGRQRLIDQVKAEQKSVEEQLRIENNRYKQQAEAAGKLPARYALARRHHLTDEALKVLKGADLAKEFGPNVPDVALQMIALELCVGRLEDAARNIADLKEGFDDRVRKGDPDPQFNRQRLFLRHLELQKLILEGNYAAAGTVMEELEGGVVAGGLDRMLAEAAKIKFDPKPYAALKGGWPVVPMLGASSPLGALALFGAGSVQLEKYLTIRDGLRRRMAADADFFFRRGFLSLLEGDMEAAKVRFRQTTREPPPGWDLPTFRPGTAAEYLRLIEAAERKP
jgi:hypothetical protein